MGHDDVDDFDRRAATYDHEHGAAFHARIAEPTADVALRAVPAPAAVLDVGCGTGTLLALLADRLPSGVELVGADPAGRMLAVARAKLGDRVRLDVAAAEALPYPDDRFDLVVSTGSFHHWVDRPAGLREIRRVLRGDGRLVLVDQFSAGRELDLVLAGAGLERLVWEPVVDVGSGRSVRAAIVRR